jgi:Xaa-Pro aminopeptidase
MPAMCDAILDSMRRFGRVYLFFILSAVAWPAPPLSEYAARRAELRKALPDSVVVLVGRTEKESDDLRSGFFQEPNFIYLTGWAEPGAALLMTPDHELFFIPKRDPEVEKWTGRKLAAEDPDVSTRTGFETVHAMDTLEAEIRAALQKHSKLYTILKRPTTAGLRQLAPLREISDASPAIAKLRMTKSAAELEMIQHATEVSMEAHRAAWKRIAPGLYEYQVANTMTATYLERGCERSAYTPIVGAGPNAVVLHYARNSRRMDSGEVLLMDVAAECGGYTSDITRTVPVNGKFTKRQREIYDIVLGAQKAAIAALKPGMTLARTGPNSLYLIAFNYINTHGKDKHGEPLGKYFTHGLGHHVGLEVHDANDPSALLAEGMVITIEPGIYLPDENIGVRIEDVVVVTENGAKVLSAALPTEPGEIERAVSK